MTDAIDRLNKIEDVLAYDFAGKRYDVGDKFGFVDTTIRFALKHPEIKVQVQALINELAD